jgi:hypothetical protein
MARGIGTWYLLGQRPSTLFSNATVLQYVHSSQKSYICESDLNVADIFGCSSGGFEKERNYCLSVITRLSEDSP